MTSRDFAFWLQGFLELENPKALTQDQTSCIKNHLALVFKHEIDPAMGTTAEQEKLNAIHSGKIDNFNPSTTLIRC